MYLSMAKLLYVAKRVKPEMLTAVAFLTTRAVAPDTDDMAKLQRALGYLRKLGSGAACCDQHTA